MNGFQFHAQDENDTERLGAALAAVLEPPVTLALEGTLGAGKTRFAQGLVASLGVPREQIVSPTFVLCQQHEGRFRVYHLDAYRLHDEDEFLDLGVEEYFEEPNVVTIIEWSDRVSNCLPEERIDIQIEVGAGSSRVFHFSSASPRQRGVIATLEVQLQQ
ncbi:MAG: tRNA threonylcarbamoyladenosine biosynthesis protein TsaE [Pirellulaceae bacterium]|jgi:tRNA threonylcarbamoyladenosine biosynthesis protein TsaE